jgi:hypothetical protein
MMVDLAHSSATDAVGRATANSATNSADNNSAGGMCRRHWRLDASRTVRKLLNRSAALPGRRSSHKYSIGGKGSASINHRF